MLPTDTAWFDADPQKYLKRPEFIRFQEVANVDFMDLKAAFRIKSAPNRSYSMR